MPIPNTPKRSRARKINGGRERVSLYLLPEEMQFVDAISHQTDMSRSSVFMRIFMLGKQQYEQQHTKALS